MNLRDGRFWDRQFECGLPDSRLAGTERDNKTYNFRGKNYERVFCANCGCDGGGITPEWSAHVFYLCDECVLKWGRIPGLVEIPEPLVRGQSNGDTVL